MQDEELDKIVREAAKQHHPPYDDNAWDKMEQLLDEHLPQKKDKRKPVWLLLLALLTVGTLFYTLIYPGINKSSDNSKELAQQPTIGNENTNEGVKNGNSQPEIVSNSSNANTEQNTTPVNIATPQPGNTQDVTVNKSNTNGNDVTTASGTYVPTNSTGTIYDPKENIKRGNNQPSSSIAINNKGRTRIRIKNAQPQEDAIVSNFKVKEKPEKKKATTVVGEVIEEEMKEEMKEVISVVPAVTQKESIAKVEDADKNKTPGPASTDKVKTDDQPRADTKNTAKKEDKKKQGFAGNFGITASAGTDLSYVDVGNLGKATFIYGAGLSYTVKKRLTIRAGFYVAKKIYSAKPSQYNGVVYPYLNKIDGDCKVYEIPVTASYNFGERGKHNWFASAGLSSFIMKKEYYNYTYKVGGSTYYYDMTLDNKNKHVFSVLNLSAGYQYNLSPRVSLMAEPFVKLPLAGVGDGKMKLNSAGILMTATVKPFSKKKKG